MRIRCVNRRDSYRLELDLKREEWKMIFELTVNGKENSDNFMMIFVLSGI